MRKRRNILLTATIVLAALSSSCNIGGDNNVTFKNVDGESYTSADLGIKGNVAKVDITEYSGDSPGSRTFVANLVFDRSGLVKTQKQHDLTSGQKTTYVFVYDPDGLIKRIKAKIGNERVDVRYRYDKRNHTRECFNIRGREEQLSEMVWYDANGYPSKLLSAKDSEKYWIYSYDPTGKMLSKTSYLNDGSGTMVLNYIHSGFVGNKWTREVWQDDEGTQYGSTEQKFNSNGDLEEMSSRTRNPVVSTKVKIQYTYDTMGNWTEMIHTSSINNEKPTTFRKTRDITYR